MIGTGVINEKIKSGREKKIKIAGNITLAFDFESHSALSISGPAKVTISKNVPANVTITLEDIKSLTFLGNVDPSLSLSSLSPVQIYFTQTPAKSLTDKLVSEGHIKFSMVNSNPHSTQEKQMPKPEVDAPKLASVNKPGGDVFIFNGPLKTQQLKPSGNSIFKFNNKVYEQGVELSKAEIEAKLNTSPQNT